MQAPLILHVSLGTAETQAVEAGAKEIGIPEVITRHGSQMTLYTVVGFAAVVSRPSFGDTIAGIVLTRQ